MSSAVNFSYDAMAHDLAHQGWFAARNAFTPALLKTLSTRLHALEQKNALSPAGIGRGAGNATHTGIRRDHTLWLETENAEEQAFLQEMETLGQALNQRLLLGLFSYEAHFALYAEGAYYKRHYDSFQGKRNRIVSTVLYLNADWQKENGGELAVYENHGAIEPFLFLLPEWGTFIAFLSEGFPHEVLPATRPRRSIAGWFRCNPEI